MTPVEMQAQINSAIVENLSDGGLAELQEARDLVSGYVAGDLTTSADNVLKTLDALLMQANRLVASSSTIESRIGDQSDAA